MSKTQACESAWKGLKGIVEKTKTVFGGETVILHLANKTPKGKMTTSRKRNLIVERGRKCEYCDEEYMEWVFETHHIIPREYMECSDEKDNLMVLCANCHREFSHKWDEIRRHAKKDEVELSMKLLRDIPKYIIE